MKQWQPAPKHMALELMKVRWTKENPAPDVVVHLWMWHLVSSGGTVTVRDIMDYAGWSKWKSHNFKKEFVTFRNHWVSHDSGQKPDKNVTATPTISTTCEPAPDAYTGHSRARAVLNTPTTLQTTVNKTHKADKDSLDALWEKVNAIRTRAGHTRKLELPKPRRRVLRARVKEYSEGDVLRVVEWWLFSEHNHAVFLRERNTNVDTIISPSKFHKYLEASFEKNQASSKPKGVREMMEELDEQEAPLNVYHFNQE
jgi:hypothetical protein